MGIQFNSNTMPLRRRTSTENFGGGGSAILRRKMRLSVYGVTMLVFIIGASFCVQKGLITSLSESKIHSSMEMFDKPKGRPSRIHPNENYNLSRPDSTNHHSSTKSILVKTNSDIQRLRGESSVGTKVEGMPVPPTSFRKQAPIQRKKPRLFLHVGPQKTGSSTLQSMLDKLSDLTEELKGDNTFFRHIMPEAGDFECDLNQWGGYHNCKASEKLKALIEKARIEGKNLLLTDENLGKDFVVGLRDAIDDSDWDVTVIVMYRRIHEWLISWYNQINKTTNKDSKGNVLFDDKGIPYRTEHTNWPDQGGSHIPSFSKWYGEYTRHWDADELPFRHRSIEYYNLYKDLFGDVLFYDMYQEGSMVTILICNIIGATNACQRLKSQEIKVEEVNASVNLDHDILSVHAYEQGLVSKTLQRKQVLHAVTNYIQETGKSIPRTCDMKVTEQIRTWLMNTEKIFVGEQNWSIANEQELSKIYGSFLTSGKLCDIDKAAILEDPEWIEFFHSLGKTQLRNLVMYVGPVGGKEIHIGLNELLSRDRGLQLDNYSLIVIEEKIHFECTEITCTPTTQLRSLLSSLENKKNDVIISNDNLDDRYVKAFKDAVDENKWKLKIVIGYVRLDQLLLAMYETSYNNNSVDMDWSRFVGQGEHSNIVGYSKWPDQGGETIPGFNEWFGSIATDLLKNKSDYLGPKLRNLYTSSFDDVEFYAYQPGQAPVKDFVCQIVPGAKQTCKAMKALDSAKRKTLLADYNEADLLAVGARERGLVKKHVARDIVRNTIRWKLETTGKSLARSCDTEITKHLYDWMIEIEKVLTGDKFNSKRIAWINKDLQALLQAGKLCNLDVEKELEDLTWINMFRYNPNLQ